MSYFKCRKTDLKRRREEVANQAKCTVQQLVSVLRPDGDISAEDTLEPSSENVLSM